jgi:hypothetical protein
LRAEYDLQYLAPTGIDYDALWCDNRYETTRAPADFLRTGTNQPKGDAAASKAMRQFFVEYDGHLQRLRPGLKIGGNLWGTAASDEYRGRYDFAYLEAQIGRYYSLETTNGWQAMQNRYTGMLANVKAGGAVAFGQYGTATDYAAMRFGFASALQADGCFCYAAGGTDISQGTPTWFDEYDAPLGKRIGTTLLNGLSVARYENGMAVVNTTGQGKYDSATGKVITDPAKGATLTIDLTGYRRLAGAQDPAVNNGMACGVESLAPRTGLIVLK